ncbi:FadR/GntR family transcriptional regulator [Sphingosinicella sp. BN140058]|uniref:FadR/GntR family transcriptional regulator n=1 Tax=Sphingosinicella sp. BN140058 TaxID=1892855 RepID=UPI001011110B|nr:FadR/GntR family transcriptional regulator [Sphingosinicella sp. BN140058]QAY76293.1 FadR family transcriptional regulator [Sphingosinicella sp. BN140058]
MENPAPRADLLSAQLAQSLGRAIVAGRLAVGSSLPTEADLCRQHGASRTAVREALKVLGGKGLVSARPRLGASVRDKQHWSMLDADVLRWMRDAPVDRALLLDLAQLRLAIEPEAASAAAHRRDPQALGNIAAAIEAMEGDPAEALQADIAFHAELLRASGNRFFASQASMVESALSMSIPVTNAAKRVAKADVEAHRIVYLAIRDGDAAAASTHVRAHILESVRLLKDGQA